MNSTSYRIDVIGQTWQGFQGSCSKPFKALADFSESGWKANFGDCHCVACARKRFGQFTSSDERMSPLDEHNIPVDTQDREGNPIHPMFSTDEQLEPQYCGDCHGRIE